MKVIFLGTNGWYTTTTGNTPCILLDTKDYYVVFDAGNGIYKLDSYIKEKKPIYLFISHFHLDHVSGLHSLAKFDFPQGIDIYVGPGRKEDFISLVNPPFTIGFANNPKNISNLRYDVRVHELNTGVNDIGFPVYIFEMFHAYRNHGYRVELEGKVISYSGDTGICANSLNLAKDADILIHECSNKKNLEKEIWGHVDPSQAASLAKNAKVKQLILTHFAADKYLSINDRKTAEKEAQKIFPNTAAAVDDFALEL